MDFSIAIVTRNRAGSLKKGLEALSKQTYLADHYEVIVADNGSTDDTWTIVEEMRGRFSNFRYLYEPRPGQLAGWHLALQEAKGEIACFIDDDVRPDETWLSALGNSYEDPRVGLATGPINLEFEAQAPPWLEHMLLGKPGSMTLPFLGLLDCGPAVCEIPSNFVWGSNFSARKNLLIDVGGFHPCAMPRSLLHFYGDGEIYPGRAITERGFKAVYHPEASVRHMIPSERLTLKAVEKKFETTGYARSFQTLRKSGKAYSEPREAEILEIAKRYFRNWEVTPEDLRLAVAEGLTTGIRNHLNFFNEDPNFRRWVLRDSYLNVDRCYDHPDLIAYQSKNGQPETDWRQDS